MEVALLVVFRVSDNLSGLLFGGVRLFMVVVGLSSHMPLPVSKGIYLLCCEHVVPVAAGQLLSGWYCQLKE